MKILAVVAALAVVLMFVVTGCTDRTRHTCETKPDGRRCNTSIGATTP
jgi:type IV pilus biogenesis protein CpaD/CtpE